jgi:hypothetical protein
MGIPDFQKLDKWEDTVVNSTGIFLLLLYIHHLLSLQNGNMFKPVLIFSNESCVSKG